MKKTFLNESICPLSEEEKRYNKASYRRVLEMYSRDIVLCNNIIDVDESVLYNCPDLYDEEEDSYTDIYQWYLCDLTEYERDALTERGVIISHSDLLDLDVICVDHYGTSWDYVLTDSELTTDLFGYPYY